LSINDATSAEWDQVRKDRHFDNRPFPKPECELVKPMPELPKDKLVDAIFDLDRYAPSPDPVNQPAHYRVGEVEAIDYIAQQLGTGVKDYLLGNVHKYLHRHRFKGQALEDLRKAEWYLDKLIMEEEQGG